jgi:hypothetical protein
MVLAVVLLAAVAKLPSSYSFTVGSPSLGGRPSTVCVAASAAAAPASADEGTKTTARMADSGVPPATSASSSSIADGVDIPTHLPSDAGLDYVPLATMLASGQLAEADQVRNSLMRRLRPRSKRTERQILNAVVTFSRDSLLFCSRFRIRSAVVSSPATL